MIEFHDSQHKAQRRDIVSFCPNCLEISGSQFVRCPSCGDKVKKKQIKSYIHDTEELEYNVIILTKSELINRFVDKNKVEKLDIEQLIKISRLVELFIYHRMEKDIFNYINNLVDNLTKCIK